MITSLTDWNLPDRDVVRLREVLHDDERVVLVAKPRVKMHGSDVFFVMLPGVVLVAFLCYVVNLFGEEGWTASLFFLPCWVLALALLSSPLRYRRRMERTLYVLTDKRAVVFEQLTLWRNRCVCWPLFPGLVKKVAKDGNDCGSLIFDYENRWTFKRRRSEPQPVGFLAVPHLAQVQQVVEEQIAAVPPEKAPFAYRPSVLSTPAPLLDSWGTPLPRQAKKESASPARVLLILGIWFIVLPSLLMVVGLGMLREEQRLANEGAHATATVLRVKKSVSSSGRRGGSSVSYFPTLQFTDAAGVQRTVEYTISTDNYPVGHRLPITYLPNDPGIMRIEDGGMSPGLYFVLSSGFSMLVGVAMLMGRKKMLKPAK